MRIDVVTIFPGMFGALDWGVLRRAREAGLVDIRVHDLRSWTRDRHRSTDDTPYGGGPAMVVVDAVVRLIPGAISDPLSAEEDSFSRGLLDCPHYTRPLEFRGLRVPDVLVSGDHAAIRRWRKEQALRVTWARRPELLVDAELDEEEREVRSTLPGVVRSSIGR